MSERARAGLALGSGLAVVVVVAVAVPCGALVHERFFQAAPVVAVVVDPVAAPVVVVVDVTAARAALEEVARGVAREGAAATALEQRAREAERGDRLRLLGRLVAKARDVRRAAGQAGPQLRGPFPVDELGDLGFAAFDDARWLMTRDGRILKPAPAPPAATPERIAALTTTGREEEALVIEGAPRLVRRCVAAEAYCIVDVEGPIAARASIDLAPLRQQIDALAKVSTPIAATPQAPSSSSSSSSPLLAGGAVALGLALAFLVVARLRQIADAVVAAALRLRAGVAGRVSSAPAPMSAELGELNRAIDDAFAALGVRTEGVVVDDDRRARLTAVADALDAARARGGVERVPAVDADDAVTARIVQSANGLLDALDDRARRFKVLLDDAGDANSVLPSLAQRLLRLARVPGLAQPVVDELVSLGNAVGARVGGDQAFDVLQGEVARVAPGGNGPAERFATVGALRDLPPADIARLTTPSSSTSESPPPPPRPID
ncbi:MAG: hypothetical protein Q8O67_12010 [Deltaproteobacteria bacterium]|nr:hypothetical protein [Deltaproteobacteria bacterium]